MAVDVVFRGTPDELSFRLVGLSQGSPELMENIGEAIVQDSRTAFTDQRLGDEVWPARYENQKPPKLNIAGVLADFTASPSRRKPKSRRFQDRPVLFDRGDLAGSVAVQSKDNIEAEIGTTKTYASTQFFGGISTQPVGAEAKKGLARWLGSKSGQQYEEKAGFLLDIDELDTTVQARTYMGITEERRLWIIKQVEQWAKKEIEGDG